MKNLKNSKTTSPNTFRVITDTLIEHKAKRILQEYSDDGKITAISFSLEINGILHNFKLPARYENVERIFYNQKNKNARSEWQRKKLTDAEKEQAYRTAWANIRDWLTAQMALLDTEMVKFEEVFLPYMTNQSGETYFEVLEQNQFKLTDGQQ